MTPHKKALDSLYSLYECCFDSEQAITAFNTLKAALEEREGWVLVPVEPTEEMLQAAAKSRAMDYFHDMGPDINNRPRACYKAMIAAAPKPGETDDQR